MYVALVDRMILEATVEAQGDEDDNEVSCLLYQISATYLLTHLTIVKVSYSK